MDRTDKVQIIGILLSFIIACVSLWSSYLTNKDMKCIQESVPRIIARVQLLNAAKDKLAAEQRTMFESITGLLLDLNDENANNIARQYLVAMLNQHAVLQKFPLSVRPFLDAESNERLQEILKYDYGSSKIRDNSDANTFLAAKALIVQSRVVAERSQQTVDFMTEVISSLVSTSIAGAVCR